MQSDEFDKAVVEIAMLGRKYKPEILLTAIIHNGVIGAMTCGFGREEFLDVVRTIWENEEEIKKEGVE